MSSNSPSRPLSPKDRLIVALDVPSVEEAEKLVAQLGEDVSFYKIGLELIYAGGLDFAKQLKKAGKKIFLDVKLHDIPTTVSRACSQLQRFTPDLLTIHAYPQTMQAAYTVFQGSSTTLLAVSVLTSYNEEDLYEAGYRLGIRELVLHRLHQAQRMGIQGLVLSAHELKTARALGPSLRFVVPGIRLKLSDAQDQKRTMSPAEALQAGADHCVVGRPITQSPDPPEAARAILADMASIL